MVVPHEGTWIEIPTFSENTVSRLTFPTRERGLKFEFFIFFKEFRIVVPHEGTWIEIHYPHGLCRLFPSFPTRERGLKSAQYGTNVYNAASFPTRERGLKLKPLYRFRCTDTSFPTRERGLKLPSIASLLSGSSRRSPRGNVD